MLCCSTTPGWSPICKCFYREATTSTKATCPSSLLSSAIQTSSPVSLLLHPSALYSRGKTEPRQACQPPYIQGRETNLGLGSFFLLVYRAQEVQTHELGCTVLYYAAYKPGIVQLTCSPPSTFLMTALALGKCLELKSSTIIESSPYKRRKTG